LAKCPFCAKKFHEKRLLEAHLMLKHPEHQDALEPIRNNYKRRSDGITTKYMIIDGNNVAYCSGEPPSVRLIKHARVLVVKAKYLPIVIISAALRHKIDDPVELQRMINLNWIIEAEGHTDDDILIIETALSKSAKILSNDRFIQYDKSQYKSSDWSIINALVKFAVINGKLSVRF
jgi:hypothetical protein